MYRYYDLYRRLRLQFLVLLMMGAVIPRSMCSNFAVNKYLHTVASSWIFINTTAWLSVKDCAFIFKNKILSLLYVLLDSNNALCEMPPIVQPVKH